MERLTVEEVLPYMASVGPQGQLEIADTDGDVVCMCYVPEGNRPMGQFVGQYPKDYTVGMQGMHLMPAEPQRVEVVKTETHFESGANPDFKPRSNAEQMMARMEMAVKNTVENERRTKALLARTERMFEKEAGAQVVDDYEPVEETAKREEQAQVENDKADKRDKRKAAKKKDDEPPQDGGE